MKTIPDINTCLQSTNLGVALIVRDLVNKKTPITIDDLFLQCKHEYENIVDKVLQFEDFFEAVFLLYCLDNIVLIDGGLFLENN